MIQATETLSFERIGFSDDTQIVSQQCNALLSHHENRLDNLSLFEIRYGFVQLVELVVCDQFVDWKHALPPQVYHIRYELPLLVSTLH